MAGVLLFSSAVLAKNQTALLGSSISYSMPMKLVLYSSTTIHLPFQRALHIPTQILSTLVRTNLELYLVILTICNFEIPVVAVFSGNYY